MVILDLSKYLFFIFFFILSCDNKMNKCENINLNSYILIRGYKSSDEIVKTAYLISYTDNFQTIKDSTIAENIINFHKKGYFKSEVSINFDSKISTANSYKLVLNNKNSFNISNYVLASDSVMVGMNLQKTCFIDSMLVNNKFVKKIGVTFNFHKNLGYQ